MQTSGAANRSRSHEILSAVSDPVCQRSLPKVNLKLFQYLCLYNGVINYPPCCLQDSFSDYQTWLFPADIIAPEMCLIKAPVTQELCTGRFLRGCHFSGGADSLLSDQIRSEPTNKSLFFPFPTWIMSSGSLNFQPCSHDVIWWTNLLFPMRCTSAGFQVQRLVQTTHFLAAEVEPEVQKYYLANPNWRDEDREIK